MFSFDKKKTATDPASTWLSHCFLVNRLNQNFVEFSFAYNVLYVIKHDNEGAIAINLARAHASSLNATTFEWGSPSRPWITEKMVLAGGPVSENEAWVLSDNPAMLEQPAIANDHAALSFNLYSVKNFDQSETPVKFHFGCGHAAWGSGQLEQEIVDGTWLTLPVVDGWLFDVPWYALYLECIDLYLRLQKDK